MNRFYIDFYETEDKKEPVKDFLLSLDGRMQAKVYRIIDLLEEDALSVREPYVKHLTDGIFEIRAKVGSNITRKLKRRKNSEPIMRGGRKRMSSVRGFINEQLKDPEIRKEYDALKPEFDVAKALMEARRIRNLTQQELAEKVGMEQADISNLEGGRRNPSCALLYRLAEGMDMNLELKFIPKESVPDQRP